MVLILLGLLASGYLLSRSFALILDEQSAGFDLCSEALGLDCDPTLKDESAWFLGVPWAGWGVVYFGTLLLLLVMAGALGEAFALEAVVGAVLVGILGLAISLALTISMLGGQGLACPLCLFVHLVNLCLVPALLFGSGKSFSQFRGALANGCRFVLGGTSDRPADAAWKVVGFLMVLLAAIVIYEWIFAQAQIRLAVDLQNGSEVLPTEIIERFLAEPMEKVSIAPRDARLGPRDAPVQLVIFSDFQCPGCRRLAHEIPKWAEHHDGELVVVFKHYPLSMQCNRHVKSDLHPWACPLARAASAAQQQQKFWAFHDAAFSLDPDFGEKTIEELGRAIGLDLEQFAADQSNDATGAQIQADIEEGARLNVKATPTVFINGRRVPELTVHALEVLIEHELPHHHH